MTSVPAAYMRNVLRRVLRRSTGRGVPAIADLPAEALSATWRSLLIDPHSVATARAFTTQHLAAAKLDPGHIDDVVLVVSELVSNAITHGAGGDGARNVNLELGIWSKWTLIAVDDRDPHVYGTPPAHDGDDQAESGRGLLIVRTLTERFWWHPKRLSKTANAVILRPGVKLTDVDRAILDDLENHQ